MRQASIQRTTKETDVSVALCLEGGEISVSTGIGFFDHMLTALAFYAGFGLELSALGDLHVDGHHTVEDTGIVIGQALAQALGDKKGIRRYGSAILPMDDALVLCAVDLGGRPWLNYDCSFPSGRVGDLDTELVREFFYGITCNAAINLHIRLLDGINTHHMIEAMFKAFAKALDTASGFDPRITDVLSTKGSL